MKTHRKQSFDTRTIFLECQADVDLMRVMVEFISDAELADKSDLLMAQAAAFRQGIAQLLDA